MRGWNSLKPSSGELPDLIDEKPFVDVGNGIASYLIKSGNNIKKRATNERELLEISFDELGDRIGKPTAEMAGTKRCVQIRHYPKCRSGEKKSRKLLLNEALQLVEDLPERYKEDPKFIESADILQALKVVFNKAPLPLIESLAV